MKREKIIREVISYLFILLFFYTGISKLMTYQTFQFDIFNTRFGKDITPYIAIVIPLVEIVVATLLLIHKTNAVGLYSSLIMMAIFTIYVLLILIFAKHKPCSCGGVIRELSWTQHLWFNLVFTALAGIAVLIEKNERKMTKFKTQ